ncbi:MAG: polyprenol monophosphomannose synthase [Actinobacteria bacterium]|nr:polyprenol monophosphomannose synthase [Actinomycetota bacterium]
MTARALVVVPTYNERETLPEVIARVLAVPADVDLLIVDDGSPDGTGAIADEHAERSERVSVLHRPAKAGLGPAYRAGLAWGVARGYGILVEMDADLSHDPGQLPALLAAAERSDLVIGSRYVPGGRIENWPRRRLLLSAGGNAYVRLVTGMPVRDATSGYRAFRSPVLDGIGLADLRSDGYAFQLETALRTWRAGFVIEEVPITFVERRAGASKISRAIVVEAVWRVLGWGLRGPRRAGRRHPASVTAAGVEGHREDG